jgi:hypothetical protein
MYKAYKAEFILGLIGSIIGIVAFIVAITLGFTSGWLLGVAIGIIDDIFAMIFLLVAFILGFVGTSKLNKNDKGGGILLIVSGGLSLLAIILSTLTSVVGFFSLALFLTGGIMALCRNPQAPLQ